MRDRIIIILVLLMLFGCKIFPIDSPSRWGGGKVVDGKDCSWYISQEQKKYCAYDDHKADPSKLKYEECNSCENYIKNLINDTELK